MADLAQAFSEVKSLPDHILQREISSPSGMIPGWLALGEIHERKRMRATTGPNPGKRPSMAEEYAGSIQDIYAGAGLPPARSAQAMSPQPPPSGGIANLPPAPAGGLASMPQAQPQGYYGGGIVGLADGGRVMSIEEYIRNRAPIYGVDPGIAVRVAQSEGGLTNLIRQSDYVKNGVREQSYGPFQLYMNGGLGNRALAAGIDPRTPEGAWRGIDFALAEAGKKGWGQWYGAKRVGIGNMEGIGGDGSQVPVYDLAEQMNGPAAAATQAADVAASTAATDTANVVASTAADTAGKMTDAETGSNPMSQYFMMQMLLGGGQQQEASAPAPMSSAPGRPVDARQFVQNPFFMQRRGTYG